MPLAFLSLREAWGQFLAGVQRTRWRDRGTTPATGWRSAAIPFCVQEFAEEQSTCVWRQNKCTRRDSNPQLSVPNATTPLHCHSPFVTVPSLSIPGFQVGGLAPHDNKCRYTTKSSSLGSLGSSPRSTMTWSFLTALTTWRSSCSTSARGLAQRFRVSATIRCVGSSDRASGSL